VQHRFMGCTLAHAARNCHCKSFDFAELIGGRTNRFR
jgi:hypothetical protein